MRPEITTLLDACRQGEASARDLLFERIYTELKRIARGTLRRSGPQLTISPSTLVHEVFLRLAGRDWNEVHGQLMREWDSDPANFDFPWVRARPAIRDAWDRLNSLL